MCAGRVLQSADRAGDHGCVVRMKICDTPEAFIPPLQSIYRPFSFEQVVIILSRKIFLLTIKNSRDILAAYCGYIIR